MNSNITNEEILEKLLLPLNNDIPEGIFKYFCSSNKSQEEITKNNEIILSFY